MFGSSESILMTHVIVYGFILVVSYHLFSLSALAYFDN
jgi:hypothetical protein